MLSGHPQDMVMPTPPDLGNSPWGWVGAMTITAFAGPWGITYAPNLTPDTNTGMGIWTEEMFLQAMKSGQHMGAGHPIMPPMPWMNLASLPEDDLKAVYAYLRSIPAIPNRVPEYVPPPEPADSQE